MAPPSVLKKRRVQSRRTDPAASTPIPVKKHAFVLLCGGPGVYSSTDPNHDETWDNYVTPVLLRKKNGTLKPKKDEEVHWLIYKPAYDLRWTADSSGGPVQLGHTKTVIGKGFSSYVNLLEERAKENDWKLFWISNVSDIVVYLTMLDRKISRMWFHGHAIPGELWLVLWAGPTAKVVLSNIDPAFASKFVPQTEASAQRPHRFYGCNTKDFAAKWATTYKVFAEGAEGPVHFGKIHENGGFVYLLGPPGQSATSRWLQFSPAGASTELLNTVNAAVKLPND